MLEFLTGSLRAISSKDVVIGTLLIIIGIQTRVIMVFATRFFNQQDNMMNRIMKVDEEMSHGASKNGTPEG